MTGCSGPDIPESQPDLPESQPDLPKSQLDLPESLPDLPESLPDLYSAPTTATQPDPVHSEIVEQGQPSDQSTVAN